MSQSDSSSSDDFDPAEIYTIKEFMKEQEFLDSISERIGEKLKDKLEEQSAKSSRRRSGPRRTIARNHETAHDDLVANYFSEYSLYTDGMFHRRFRMRKSLFLQIVSALNEWSPYFTYRTYATNCKGLSSLQKCTAAIRMLAYGTPADQLDEVLKIGESMALECLSNFAQGVIDKFGGEYLRPPTCDEVERLLQIGESHGFPGMIGSIDCMHWQWEKCPIAWRGQFTRGDHGVPTMILEAVASHDLRIWHAYFGVARSNNDINVLSKSPLFIDMLKGETPQVQYSVNEDHYHTSYYLADGIYPEWAVFVKTIPLSQTNKDKLFARHQEGARKDVERAFAALQIRFNIVRRPSRLWQRSAIGNIMQACVILHNMIVEDEREVTGLLDLNENLIASLVLPPEVSNSPNICFQSVLQRRSTIRARPTHTQLKSDLVEHI